MHAASLFAGFSRGLSPPPLELSRRLLARAHSRTRAGTIDATRAGLTASPSRSVGRSVSSVRISVSVCLCARNVDDYCPMEAAAKTATEEGDDDGDGAALGSEEDSFERIIVR